MPAGSHDLASVGYEEREFVVKGEAQPLALAGERTTDGQWTAVPAGDAPYVTRIVVRTPVDPAGFSGTAVVEWNNVSGGVDARGRPSQCCSGLILRYGLRSRPGRLLQEFGSPFPAWG
jgi:hypothetical protein